MSDSELRAELESKAADVRAHIDELTKPVEQGSTIGFGKRIGDGTSQAISAMEDASSAQNLQALYEQVLRAIQKTDDGSYGRCDVCGGPIGEARLEFRPWSITCIEDAE